jgi:hypothetical protein
VKAHRAKSCTKTRSIRTSRSHAARAILRRNRRECCQMVPVLTP